MTDRKDFIKIRVHLLIDPAKHFTSENGKLKVNPEYMEDFYNADAKWREPILPLINEEVGLHNWAIRFRPFFDGKYEAYIYCDKDEDYGKIVSIIQDKLNNVNFRLFARNGTVDDYIADR